MKVYIVKYKTYLDDDLVPFESHKAFANKKEAIKFQSHVKRGLAEINNIYSKVATIGTSTTRIHMDIPITAKGIIKALNL